MPIYEFKCPNCGLTVERMQAFEDLPPSCPSDLEDGEECGNPTSSASVQFERLIGRAHPRFVGSGFYINDYPKNGD